MRNYHNHSRDEALTDPAESPCYFHSIHTYCHDTIITFTAPDFAVTCHQYGNVCTPWSRNLTLEPITSGTDG